MINNVLLSVSGLVLCGTILLSPVHACDEGEDLSSRSLRLGKNTNGTKMLPASAVLQAIESVSLFVQAVEAQDPLGATTHYEKALECCPEFQWPYEMETVAIYLKLENTPKAQVLCNQAMLKIEKPTLDELRVAREVAMRCQDIEKISKFNHAIRPIIGRDFIIEDIVSFFYESFKKEEYDEAYKMWKMFVSHREFKDFFSGHMAKLGFELCVFHRDYKGVSQVLGLVKDKKSFFNSNEKYIFFAYEAYVALEQHEKLLEIMKLFGRKESVAELALVASLSELQGKYQEALEVLECIAVLNPESTSYEVLIAFCQRAEKEVRLSKQKKLYKNKIKSYKALLSKLGSSEGDVEAKKKPTPQSVGRAVRGLIAQKYMTSATDLWTRMPQDEWPELRILQEEMGTHYKACAVSFEAIKAEDSSSTVSEMRGHVEKMEKILKLVTAEKEKTRLARKRLRERENSSVETPVLFPTKSVNLRKEVLEGHGLGQKRGKQEIIEEDAPSGNVVMAQDDTPYEITWQWTPKSQKQGESLSIEAQTKLDTFMAEVTQNPWSVRRDGSLALGEPRFVTGSLFGPNTYERDMDAHNRFIYNVTATGPKSARVMILGVQGHL